MVVMTTIMIAIMMKIMTTINTNTLNPLCYNDQCCYYSETIPEHHQMTKNITIDEIQHQLHPNISVTE